MGFEGLGRFRAVPFFENPASSRNCGTCRAKQGSFVFRVLKGFYYYFIGGGVGRGVFVLKVQGVCETYRGTSRTRAASTPQTHAACPYMSGQFS